MTKTENLSVDLIKTNAGTQMRARVDQDVVDTYAELWKAKHEFPPLDVFHDGEQYILADGFHRLYGAKQAKRASIQCRVHKGSLREAILFACGANHDHGLHRSNADKQCAIDALLDDPEWGKRSARWIAEQCRVDHKTVTKRAADKKPSVLDEPKPSVGEFPNSVETKGGKTYPATKPKKLPSQSDEPPTPAEDEQPSAKKISGGTTFNPAELASESKDAFGKEAPDELAMAFQLREGFKAQRDKLASIKTWITQNENHPGAKVLATAAQRIRTDVDHADSELKFATPYCVCVYCHNKAPKVANCNACKGLGWITEPIYKAAPKGMQREKVKG